MEDSVDMLPFSVANILKDDFAGDANKKCFSSPTSPNENKALALTERLSGL